MNAERLLAKVTIGECDHLPRGACKDCIADAIKQAEQAAFEEGCKKGLDEHHCKKCQEAHKGPPYQCGECLTIGREEGRKMGLSCPGKEIEEAYLKGQREMREKILAILPTWSEDGVSCGERNNKKHKPVCHYETVASLGRRIENLPLTTRGGDI